MSRDYLMDIAPTRPLIVRVVSGLGNQLFQYAAGVSLARQLGRPLRLDTSWYDHFQRHVVKRRFALDRLNVSERGEFATGAGRYLLGLMSSGNRLLRPVADRVLPMARIQPVRERRRYRHDPGIVAGTDPDRSLYLIGYWQNHQYFREGQERFRREFTPRAGLSDEASHLLSRIHNEPSVFIHVRRGDYANFGVRMLDVEYYRSSYDRLRAMGLGNAPVYVFSEDMDWARGALDFIPRMEVVDYDSPDREIEDLMLMSECAAGIIANSSYSWWGAALGADSRRPICCPRDWHGGSEDAFSDLLFPEWIAV